MTQRYRVTGVKVRFGPGFVLELDKNQAGARSPQIEQIKSGHYRVRTYTEFKRGEEIGIVSGEVPKAWLGFLETVEGGADLSDPENIHGEVKAVHRGFGKWDVVDEKDIAVNGEPLKKQEAHDLAGKLNADKAG